MSDDVFSSREELAAKIEWEGGVMGALEYGITAAQMPDEKMRAVWTDLQNAAVSIFDLCEQVETILEMEP